MYRVRVANALVGTLLTLVGCGGGGGDGDWHLPEKGATGVVAVVGQYTFSAVGCFSVTEDLATGQRFVRFASDCRRFDTIKVDNGAFRRTHGEIDGTHCPTDSYGISGHFVSERRAEGTIKYAFDCNIQRKEEFVAALIE